MGVHSRGAAVASTFANQTNCTVGYSSDVDSRASAKCMERLISPPLKSPIIRTAQGFGDKKCVINLQVFSKLSQ